MRFAKKISKKAMSVALCTTLLAGGGLVSLTNVSHAASNEMTYRSSQGCWTETFNLKLNRKTLWGTTNLKLNLVQRNNRLTLELGNNIPDIYDYQFADTYVFGVKTSGGIDKKFELNNNNIGAFRNGNVINEVNNLINDFNSLNINVESGLTLLYAHGVKYNDTITFSGADIKRPTTNKDYSNGYKSRGIDKWKNGFQLTQNGIYECAFIHR